MWNELSRHAEKTLWCYVEKNVEMETIIGLQLFTNIWCKWESVDSQRDMELNT